MKKKTVSHILSLCLIWAQLATIPQAMGQTTQTVPNEEVIADDAVSEANDQRAENAAHEQRAIANGGVKSYCEEEDRYGNWSAYEGAAAEYSSFTAQNNQALNTQIQNLNSQGSNLLNAQGQYLADHGAFVDPSQPIEADFDAARQRVADANANLSQVNQDLTMARAELNAAQAACSDDSYCSPTERTRLRNATSRVSQLERDLIAAQNEKRAADRNLGYNAPRNVQSTADGAVNDVTTNANAMAGSHAISGCGGSSDITVNNSQECTLSGPLFDQDQELNRIANAGINEAQQMAARRADMLFDLELQQEYAADYKLYQLAVAGGFQDIHKDAGITTLDQIDGLSDNSALKTKNLKLVISNIKTVGLASAAVKDTTCEKHDESEADSKATYIFKAAAATWLMAVVQDTDYFQAESDCKAKEMLTGDENNLQIQTMERAANVKDQMLENLCLRIRPPAPPGNTYDWKIYGDSPEEAAEYVKVLNGYTDGGVTYPPLRERCEEYLVALRGEEFRDKPRTRETALEMMREAEALALEELMAKNEKLMIADANVKKGEKWVADVQRRIMITLALAATVKAAQMAAQSVCNACSCPGCCGCCSMCPVASTLNSKWIYITATVYGVYLLSELARARAFLAKWREKYRIAQYFTHVACNFETADQEEAYMASLGDRAKKKKEEEVQNAINEATRRINETVNDAVLDTQRAPASTFMDKINKDLKNIENEEQLLTFFSEKVFVNPVKDLNDLKNRLTRMGIDVLTNAFISDAHALSQPVDKRDVKSNANALNIQEGTESFRYFLVQRNLQFQNQTNDITNQPNHTRSDPKIANAGGSNKKNKAGGVIRSVEDLAQAHLDGRVMDAVSDLPKDQQTGFPTPETRYLTIQNARMIFEENIGLLNGGIAELAWQRDQTVQLLNEMRRRMSMNKQGMGETQLISGGAPRPVCMVGDVSSLNFDPTCGCANEDSCASFDFPQFSTATPNALKTGGQLATTTANSLMGGDLSGAALNGGRLVANGAAVRKDLYERLKDFDQANKNGSSTKKASEVAQDLSRGLNDTTENEATTNLASVGVDKRSGFNAARISMLQGSEFGNEKDPNKDLGKELNKGTGFGRAGRGVASVGAKGSGKEDIKSENFSLGGSSNLNLEGLTDEERARLGLGSDLAMKGKSGNGYDNDSDKYGHVRSISSQNSGSKLDKNDPFYGINQNRGRDIFKIISNRYEKTAFPVLLDFN